MSLKSSRVVPVCAVLGTMTGFAGPLSAVVIRSSQPFVGVTQYQYIQTASDLDRPLIPREIVVNIMEIDVTAPGIQFLMQPGNGSQPGEIARMTTSSFVSSVGAQVGVNVGFYDTAPPYDYPNTDLVYVSASNGSVYSPAAGGEPLFNVNANNVPSILTAGKKGATTATGSVPLYNATGGNLRILNNGAIVNNSGNSYATTLNPHTAIGVSQDQTKVYLLTVDGRQTDYSEGLYTAEMAQLLKDFGAYNAINLDGGGSTTLVMDDSNDNTANARVINSPSDGLPSPLTGPGTERVVANSLAVFANYNPDYVPLPAIAYPGQTGVVANVTQGTFLDRFEGSTGHFTSASLGSGSNHGIATTSSIAADTTRHIEGKSSLKLTIKSTNSSTSPQMQMRFLSSGGTTTNNLIGSSAMGSTGYIGFWLLLPTGSSPLYVTPLLDDGTTTQNGLERGSFKSVIADGQWHLYEWALYDAANWFNFSGGNGTVDGPDVFLDSLFFSSTSATSGGPNWSGTVWIDGIAYNPYGSVAALLPEPASLTSCLLAAAIPLFRRPRRSGQDLRKMNR